MPQSELCNDFDKLNALQERYYNVELKPKEEVM